MSWTTKKPTCAEPPSARGVHDEPDANEADHRTREVPAVGPEPVGHHAPQQRAHDEEPAVRCEHASEVGVGLEGGDEALSAE
jgi:hypothetical protein